MKKLIVQNVIRLMFLSIMIVCLQMGKTVLAETSEPEDDVSSNTFSYYVDSDNGCLTITGNGQLSGIGVEKQASNGKFSVVRPWGKSKSDVKKIKRIIIGDGIKKIPDGAFANLSNVTSIQLPDSVEEIGDYSFYGCSSLKHIRIPNEMTTLGKEAFFTCKKLTSIRLGDEIKKIGERAFYGCTSLCSIKVDKNNEYFMESLDGLYSKNGKILYQYLVGISGNVKILKRTKEIKNGAFAYGKFKKIAISKNVKYIGVRAFYNCKSLRKVTIPKNVKVLGKQSFGYCQKTNCNKAGKKVTRVSKMKIFRMTIKKKSTAYKYCKKNRVTYSLY